jgi:hypothetical protein
MYRVIDLEMREIRPEELERRLQKARNELPLRPYETEWELADLINDYGTLFAVFEARRIR